jgi:hypothetical protein
VSLQPAAGQSAPEAVQLAVGDEPNEEILFGLAVDPEAESGEPTNQLFLPLIVR